VPALWPHLIVLRARVYMDYEYASIGACALLAVGVGAMLGSRFDIEPRRPRATYVIDDRFMLVIGGLTAAAYMIWFWPIVARGQLSLERDELNQTPGVTSFTQLGVIYVVCYLITTVRARTRTSAPVRWLFGVLLFLITLRVYVSSERLALIETAVPAAVIGLRYYEPAQPTARWVVRLIRGYGPFLAIPALFVFFGATEFVRSWSTYSQTQDISMVDFMISRVATYYYTALNNGAGMLATTEWPDYNMLHILEWLYKLPFGIGQYLRLGMGSNDRPSDVFLARFADPEFNNMSGIFPIFYDVGITGGLLYFTLLGFVIGVAYYESSAGHPLGSILFPSMLVACTELLRISYLNESRSFLIVLGAMLASTQMRVAPDPYEDESGAEWA
jgi:oligosaccharide repeat unit polymerase